MSPAAVTTSASMRLSTVSPCLRMSQPKPPPRLSPPTPVWPMIPPVWPVRGLASRGPRLPTGTAVHIRRCGYRVHRDGAHRRQVDDDPVVTHCRPGHVCPPPRTAISRSRLPEAHCRSHSAAPVHRAISGDSVDPAVPHGSGIVVAGMLGGDHPAPEPGDLLCVIKARRSSGTSHRPSTGRIEKSAI